MGDNKKSTTKASINWTVFVISGGFLLLFVIVSFIDRNMVGSAIDYLFGLSAKLFGAYWQVLLLATFIIGIVLAVTKYGNVRLGNKSEPDISYYRWIAMILTTLLASGGVFWAAAEPLYHLLETPPLFGAEVVSKVEPAFAQSFMHWGFLAWAVLGTLTTIVMMYVHYSKGLPLKPRAILYPIFGEKVYEKSFLGGTADIISIIAVAAGTLGPIGFLGLQVSYGLHEIFGIPNSITVSILVVVGLVVIAAISAATGVDRGIQWLSRFNVNFTIVLAIVLFVLGPSAFIINTFLSSEAFYLQNFFTMSLYRGDEAWLGGWTVFFWGWFLGYGPMMALFISRISRGRTIRELVIAVSIVAPLVSNFWFSAVGGTGVFFELANPGSVSGALGEAGMPAAVMAIVNQLPFSTIIALGFLLVTIVFVATTADSMSYTIAVSLTGEDSPKRWLRVFWALIFGAVSAMLLVIGKGGDGSVAAIQNFIVITAVPVSILVLPPLWLAPKIAKIMALEQGIIVDGKRTRPVTAKRKPQDVI